MQVHLSSLGCRLNEAELELWSGQFQASGHEICDSLEQANLLVFNSCAVTQEAVRKSRQLISRLRRNNPDAKVVVSGCFVSLDTLKADDVSTNDSANDSAKTSASTPTSSQASASSGSDAALQHVDLVVPNAQKDDLVRLVLTGLFNAPTSGTKLQSPNASAAVAVTMNGLHADASVDTSAHIHSPTLHPETGSSEFSAQIPLPELAQPDTKHGYPVIPIVNDPAAVAVAKAAATDARRVAPASGSAVEKPTATTSAGTTLAPPTRKRQRAFIKIQDGCRYQCTYCIVTKARGAERSRRIRDLVEETNRLHLSGTHEIVLTGVHVGGYGSDTRENLAGLLEALLQDTAIPRIRFASVEPWDLEPRLLQAFHNPRVMPHMHLPLQSGSNKVLQRMARRCKTQDFQHLVEDLRSDFPDFNVTTDIIVGFPGETESEWRESLEFAETMEFGHIHVFPFSARSGTRAAMLSQQVAGSVKKQRAKAMHDVSVRSRHRYLRRFIGRSMDVLWENGKLLPTSIGSQAAANRADQQGATGNITPLTGTTAPDDRPIWRYYGYTPNYLRVYTDIQGNATGGAMAVNTRAAETDPGNSLNQQLLQATIDRLGNRICSAHIHSVAIDEARRGQPEMLKGELEGWADFDAAAV